jgi:GT2 family glycosyltransferase
MTDLTIIVVSYNTKKLTLDCLDSIYKNSKGIDVQTIVVDNNSEDGSLEALQELEDKKKIRLIRNKKNLGFSKANNQGIKTANGKHVLLLNSDTLVKHGSIKKLYEFAEKEKDAGVVGSRLLNRDGSIQPSCLHFPSIGNAIREYWFGEKGLFEKYAPQGAEPVEVDALVGACFMITGRALKKVGMLDERYFFYFEDIDYCRKVWKAGFRVYYLPTVEVVHYHGSSGRKLAETKDQWKRLIPSSKIYHGPFRHYILTGVLWLGQKWQKLARIKS